MRSIDFSSQFEVLTGNHPFPWQEKLYKRFVGGDLPDSCDIPTGLGKTAVIPIWLIALAASPNLVPRRLVYVVNRRTVVDQATDEARKIRERLEEAAGLKEKLRLLCALTDDAGGPLAISTLRGRLADNREWSADPARPAIIVGTVDMIGSRLLFGGYGLGFKTRPLHAGFLGSDALLVHDEAHLEPAMQSLIIAIRDEQSRCKEITLHRRFRVMALSATTRSSSEARDYAFGLTDDDRADPRIIKRIRAKKTVTLHENDDEKKLADRLTSLALEHKASNCAVLVFARTVENVGKIADNLQKEMPGRVQRLTGTMRGLERDGLVSTPVFERFLPSRKSDDQETVYLVCTSAGEVGINISADHLVCDLSTFESMAQRFGRVNRFGDCEDTRIDIVHPKTFDPKDALSPHLEKTLELMRKLNRDGSPEALGELVRKEPTDEAFSPIPYIPPTSDILFDAWSLTTIRGDLPGRPPLEPYLHGISAEPPRTYVAWREEVGVIKDDLQKQLDPQELLDDYPLKPHETLQDRSDRIFNGLKEIAKRRPDSSVWLIALDGTVTVDRLGDLTDKKDKDAIYNRTVLLSPEDGGLKDGFLNGKMADAADDVSEKWLDENGDRRRARIWDEDEAPPGMRLIRTVDTRPDADIEDEEAESATKRFWHWYVKPKSADDDGSRTSQKAVAWQVHTDDVERNARKIVEALRQSGKITEEIATAVNFAAKGHDLGKKRAIWQRGIGNMNLAEPLAKSKRQTMPIVYRHEFGSLIDALDDPEMKALDEHQKDLVLHLIACHHGYARPHFPADRAFDSEPGGKDADQIAAEVPRRFARLQREYGHWGLAYIESLLRAADYAASASPSQFKED